MPIMVAGMIPVLAGVGGAIDLSRIYLIRSQMQAGVDAAALAGARAFGDTTNGAGGRNTQVQVYFEENFSDGYLGAPEIVPVPQFSTNSGINVTRVTASVELPMLFMQIFGIGEKNIEVVAQAELQPKPLEVMVVLDDTGSMNTRDVGGGTRMDALKNAMYSFINILHQGSSNRSELALGFVTYTVTTNVGQQLRDAGVAIRDVDGFTNVASYTGGSNAWDKNPLGWKGCVMNDDTINDLNANPADVENDYRRGAWDVNRSLPGDADGHPPVTPYLYPPHSPRRGPTYDKNKVMTSDYSGAYETAARVADNYGGSGNNNFYLLSPGGDMAIGQRLANSPAYRDEFYHYYIGLNANSSNINDDVITTPSGEYYNPSTGGSHGTHWVVNYSRVPFITNTSHWRQPNAKYGFTTLNGRSDTNGLSRTGYNLNMPTPNWQCPEPAMTVQYGRNKSVYDDYIRYHNMPLEPASGTLHHIGMLWGYRMLTRDDKFVRNNPIENQTPLRALVFMTDGQSSTGESVDANNREFWMGAYGSRRHKRLTANGPTTTQIMRRFGKVCQAAKNDGIVVYIVSLKAAVSEFSTCAGPRYYQTEDAAAIRSAFDQIAVDLVDLHLTQ
nr:Tad domain-containing protein [Sphingomonas jejuensis]